MTEQNNTSAQTSPPAKKRSPLRKKLKVVALILLVVAALLCAAALFHNNVSRWTSESFAQRLDASISQAEKWVQEHTDDILKRKNAALLTMLHKCHRLKPDPMLQYIVKTFLDTPIRHHTVCWKREVDPNWPVNARDLNRTIQEEIIDYKWCLYAVAPDMAEITPQQMDMFNPDRWQRRQLTHQLWALLLLRRSQGPNTELDELIEHLCNRITKELVFDLAVVDIYIQKVAFVLLADKPHKIRRRWVERIITNQLPDGGWNDKWFCFTSRIRPTLSLTTPPSNQHATVQALTALYLVRYRYPEEFGLKPAAAQKQN